MRHAERCSVRHRKDAVHSTSQQCPGRLCTVTPCGLAPRGCILYKLGSLALTCGTENFLFNKSDCKCKKAMSEMLGTVLTILSGAPPHYHCSCPPSAPFPAATRNLCRYSCDPVQGTTDVDERPTPCPSLGPYPSTGPRNLPARWSALGALGVVVRRRLPAAGRQASRRALIYTAQKRRPTESVGCSRIEPMCILGGGGCR